MNSKFELLKDDELMAVEGGDILIVIGLLTLAVAAYGEIKQGIRDQGFNDAINGK